MLKGFLQFHRTFPRHRRFSLRAFVVFCSFISLSPSAWAQDKPKERVVLRLTWYHQFQFAGYYTAKHLGYYEAAGLDVENRAGSPTLDVTEQVVSGQADFGVSTSSLRHPDPVQ